MCVSLLKAGDVSFDLPREIQNTLNYDFDTVSFKKEDLISL